MAHIRSISHMAVFGYTREGLMLSTQFHDKEFVTYPQTQRPKSLSLETVLGGFSSWEAQGQSVRKPS
ncbi:hypothetical protein GX50_02948 [[Emmonsia] crescens]|uniref:Uncharacterized protein n=1 Tax=[Emmonsia] crescens TaxID=73230 RepID=A0A2B7ZLN9_9EURO|nr:hypothetical protein GX50_02948 [Emmonsia crescens]